MPPGSGRVFLSKVGKPQHWGFKVFRAVSLGFLGWPGEGAPGPGVGLGVGVGVGVAALPFPGTIHIMSAGFCR